MDPGLHRRRPAAPVSAREWDAEVDLDVVTAAALVAGQFPDLAGERVELLAAGWDNTVFRVGADWAFRFPRRSQALTGLAREVAVLPRVAPLLPLPVPAPVLAGRPTSAFPWPFYGARLLPGKELATSGLSGTARVPAAGDLGRFLAALHRPAVADAAGTGLPVDPFSRADPATRLTWSLPWFERLAAADLWTPGADVDALYAEARTLHPPTGPPVLVHGDLHLRHLLVDRRGRATGVIDWGDVCLADPAVDLSIAFAAFDGDARAAFFSAYGAVDAERELRARVLALSLTAALADHAASTGDTDLLAEALAALRRAVT